MANRLFVHSENNFGERGGQYRPLLALLGS
jgi:hypothetical protein